MLLCEQSPNILTSLPKVTKPTVYLDLFYFSLEISSKIASFTQSNLLIYFLFLSFYYYSLVAYPTVTSIDPLRSIQNKV